MANYTGPNCTSLVDRSSFTAYVQTLRNQTHNNLTLAASCKTDICNALWGTGNPDISGIGMIIGYILQQILSPALVIALLLRPTSTLLAHVYITYTDCTLFFTASVQLATFVVLIRHDYGISASGLAGLTVEITWSVALITLLGAMLPVFYPPPAHHGRDEKGKPRLRFAIFWVCWIAFFYSFISRMIQISAPAEKGGGTTAGALNDTEWTVLTDMCFSGSARGVSAKEETAISVLGVMGSVFVSVFAVGRFGWEVLRRQNPEGAESMERKKVVKKIFGGRRRGGGSMVVPVVLVLVVPVLAIPVIWAVFRLRDVERALARNTGSSFVDNEWTFGQVVAVFLFAPVFVEGAFLWRRDSRLREE